jgi:hypothetical protein
VRASGGWRRGQREIRECSCVCCAGPYRMGRYVSAHVLNIHEINKKTDTLWTRIHRVSAAYPYWIRIRYGIRHLPGVSVLRREKAPELLILCFCYELYHLIGIQ